MLEGSPAILDKVELVSLLGEPPLRHKFFYTRLKARMMMDAMVVGNSKAVFC